MSEGMHLGIPDRAPGQFQKKKTSEAIIERTPGSIASGIPKGVVGFFK